MLLTGQSQLTVCKKKTFRNRTCSVCESWLFKSKNLHNYVCHIWKFSLKNGFRNPLSKENFQMCHRLKYGTLLETLQSMSVVFTAVSCSWHSVCPAHSSGTRQARVCRHSPSCLELAMSGACQHLTNLNSAWKPIFLYSPITHSLVSVELSRTTFPLCL